MGGLAVGVKINAPITGLRWVDIRDLAVAADEVGLDSVQFPRHLLASRGHVVVDATPRRTAVPARLERPSDAGHRVGARTGLERKRRGVWNSPDGFARLNARIDEECEERGVAPDTVWRSAELYAQFDGAHGLPIDLPELPAHQGVGAVTEALEAMAEAGADLVQVLVDPQEPRAVHHLAEAAVAAGATLRRN